MKLRLFSVLVLVSCGVAAATACSSGHEDPEDDRGAPLRTDDFVDLPRDAVAMGVLVYEERLKGVRLPGGEKQAFILRGSKVDALTIDLSLAGSGARARLSIAGPATPGVGAAFATVETTNGRASLANVALPENGLYLITLENLEAGDVRYSMNTGCRGPSPRRGCAPFYDSPMAFGRSRITQAAIDRDRYTTQELFQIGDFLFNHSFTVEEGWGNALSGGVAGTNGRPNTRRVHNGQFGAPDSSSCQFCHSQGGRDGAGDLATNAFLEGDGTNVATALVRNPKQVIGVGYLQALAREMSEDLQKIRAQAKANALRTQAPVTLPLVAKGISFGSISVAADGTIDGSKIEGVDPDLVVKPFGWTGREATLRTFIDGAFRTHIGIQSEVLVKQHCAAPIPLVAGNGPDCTDPDGDGVRNEMTEGQLTAVSVYAALQQVPQQIIPADPTLAGRIRQGAMLFEQIGCANCHVTKLELRDPIHREVASTGHALELDLTLDGEMPQLPLSGDGTVLVPLLSDLKRHDLGPKLGRFLTPPLWGMAVTFPYLHDGRAGANGGSARQAIFEVVFAHEGEAASAKAAFEAMGREDTFANRATQFRRTEMVIDFLMSLGRDPAQTGLDK
jgi:mono/diheme cytochrome c family protein